MTIAVTGATGQLGRLVIENLKQRGGADIVALARDPNKADDLGVAVREADYDRPETLGPALQDVDTLVLISGSEVGKRTQQHRNVIEAAKTAGVGRIVYTSLLRADSSPLSLAEEHKATETMIAEAGLPATILRNGWYTENYLGSLPAAIEHGTLIGSAGEGRIAFAPRKDYAEAAAVVALDDSHAGQTYELAGDQSHTLADLAAEAARQTGKPVTYADLPEADYAKALEGFGLPAPLAAAIAGWDVGASEGALFDDSGELSALIGRPTTPLAEVVAEAIA